MCVYRFVCRYSESGNLFAVILERHKQSAANVANVGSEVWFRQC